MADIRHPDEMRASSRDHSSPSQPRPGPLSAGAVRSAVLDALAIVAPTVCAGCGWSDRTICDGCRVLLRPYVRAAEVDGLRVTYAHDYAGAVRSALAAFKDGGRTDAAPHLAPALTAAVASALRDVRACEDACRQGAAQPGAVGPSAIHLVTVPSSRAAFRSRGYVPVSLLLKHAGLRAEKALMARRVADDQAGLSAERRRENRAGWLHARGWVAGERVLLVDDILTTGSTLLEARRALADAGAHVVGAAVLARTPRRSAGEEADA